MTEERESSGTNLSKPIVIRDGDGTLELWPREINGVVVYTPTDEKSRELEERFRSYFVPCEKKIAWWRRVGLFFCLLLRKK